MGLDREAWDLAYGAAERAGAALRALTDLRDADRVRAVVDHVWGDQAPPREILRAMQHSGSVLIGAEDRGDLIGFVWGWLGYRGGVHLHSHMLAVVPEWERRGVGFALKLAQRAACLSEGVEEVRWTYDPLLARNARFNLVKLGTEAFTFLPDFYGEMADRLNRGDRSDRFEVRWALRSARVTTALSGSAVAPDPGPDLIVVEGPPDEPNPAASGRAPVAGCRVAIPGDHYALRTRDPELAARWRAVASERFRACFAQGLVATWFTDDARYVFDLPERS
jgi:predicted GNAT superfamily acetyltransferase